MRLRKCALRLILFGTIPWLAINAVRAEKPAHSLSGLGSGEVTIDVTAAPPIPAVPTISKPHLP